MGAQLRQGGARAVGLYIIPVVYHVAPVSSSLPTNTFNMSSQGTNAPVSSAASGAADEANDATMEGKLVVGSWRLWTWVGG